MVAAGERRTSRNASALLLARLVSAGTTLILMATLGRMQGADALGIVGIGMATGALLAAVTDLGASLLVIRAIAECEERARQIIGFLTLLRLLTMPVGLISAFLVLASVFPTHALAVWLAAAWLTVQQLTELPRASFMAAGRIGLVAMHVCAENLLWLAAIMLPLAGGAGMEFSFACGLVVLCFSTVSAYLLLWLLVGWRPARPSRQDAAWLLRQTPSFSTYAVAVPLYSRVDILLVGALVSGGLATAGGYFAAMKVITTLEYVPDAVARAAYPGLSRAAIHDPRGLWSVAQGPERLLLWLSVPLPFGILLAAPWGFPLLFGPEVAPYGWVLACLGLFIPLRWLGYLLGIMLTSGGAQGRRALTLLLAAVIVIVLDFVLLPRLGLVGAIIGAAAAWCTVFGIYATSALRAFGPPNLARTGAVWLGFATLGFVTAIGADWLVGLGRVAPAPLLVFGLIYAGASILWRWSMPVTSPYVA